MVSTEKGLPVEFFPGPKQRAGLGFDVAKSKNVKWVAKLGSKNYSSPVIAAGRVYIGTNDELLDDPRFRSTGGGVLKCFDERDGRLLWQLVAPKLEIDRSKVSEDFDDMNLGICGTVTVVGDRVYLVSNRCEVLCLDVHGLANGNDGPFVDEPEFCVSEGEEPAKLGPDDADIVWRFDMIRDLPTFPHDASNSGVLVHGDCVYVGTSNGVYDGKVVLPQAATLIALDRYNGRFLARDQSGISARVFHGQWSTPALTQVNGRPLLCYGGGDGYCYGFELLRPGGKSDVLKEVWRFDGNPNGYRIREGQPINYWALARGAKNDEFRSDSRLISPSEIIGTPVVYENRLYVTIGQDPLHGPGCGAISCLDPSGTGDITKSHCVWRYTDIGRSMSTVSIADGLLYAAETFGKVHCLDARTGEVHWVWDAGDEIWSSTFVADGKVYYGTRRGLTVLAAGKKLEHLADIRLGSPIWSVPSAANGTLYVASQKNLFAVQEQGEMNPIGPQPMKVSTMGVVKQGVTPMQSLNPSN